MECACIHCRWHSCRLCGGGRPTGPDRHSHCRKNARVRVGMSAPNLWAYGAQRPATTGYGYSDPAGSVRRKSSGSGRLPVSGGAFLTGCARRLRRSRASFPPQTDSTFRAERFAQRSRYGTPVGLRRRLPGEDRLRLPAPAARSVTEWAALPPVQDCDRAGAERRKQRSPASGENTGAQEQRNRWRGADRRRRPLRCADASIGQKKRQDQMLFLARSLDLLHKSTHRVPDCR